MTEKDQPKLFVGFSEVPQEQFSEVYDALSEPERKRLSWLFFSMFCRVMDAQSSVMDDLLAEAHKDRTAASYTIKYGLRLADAMHDIREPLLETMKMWNIKDGTS